MPNCLVLSVLLPSRVVAEVSVLLEVRVPYVSVSLLSKQSSESSKCSAFAKPMLPHPPRPDVTFFCDIDYDPFLVMQDKQKMYGFTISLYEYEATIPTLWNAVKGVYPELFALS